MRKLQSTVKEHVTMNGNRAERRALLKHNLRELRKEYKKADINTKRQILAENAHNTT